MGRNMFSESVGTISAWNKHKILFPTLSTTMYSNKIYDNRKKMKNLGTIFNVQTGAEIMQQLQA